MLRVRYLLWYAMVTIILTGLSTDTVIALLVNHGTRMAIVLRKKGLFRRYRRNVDNSHRAHSVEPTNDNVHQDFDPERKTGS